MNKYALAKRIRFENTTLFAQIFITHFEFSPNAYILNQSKNEACFPPPCSPVPSPLQDKGTLMHLWLCHDIDLLLQVSTHSQESQK